MKELTQVEVDQASGAMTIWGFTAVVLSVGAASIAVCTAPAWGAAAAVVTIGAIGANAIDGYSRGR